MNDFLDLLDYFLEMWSLMMNHGVIAQETWQAVCHQTMDYYVQNIGGHEEAEEQEEQDSDEDHQEPGDEAKECHPPVGRICLRFRFFPSGIEATWFIRRIGTVFVASETTTFVEAVLNRYNEYLYRPVLNFNTSLP